MASHPDPALVELTQKLRAVYERVRHNPEEMAFLDAALTLPPARRPLPSLLPMHEYETRLDLAVKCRSWHRRTGKNWNMNSLEFMVFMQASMASLGVWESGLEVDEDARRGFGTNLVAIHLAVKCFLFPDRKQFGIPSWVGRRNSSGSDLLSIAISDSISKHHEPDEAQKILCLNRDGHACVVTGGTDPVVCHIMPFFWTSSGENAFMSESLVIRLSKIFGLDTETHDLLAYQSESDKAWNMICLSSTLQNYWRRAYFGFKVLSNAAEMQASTEEWHDITLQLLWLPQPPRDQEPDEPGLSTIDLDQQTRGPGIQTYVDSLNSFDHTSRKTDTFYCKEKWPIFSGSVFTVRLSRDDAIKFIRMMELQWALVKLISMSGAANADPIDLNYDLYHAPEPEREARNMDTSERVSRWLEDARTREAR